jgi:hypothetical protein
MNVTELSSLETLDAEPFPAFVIDRAGLILYTNPAWERLAQIAGGPLADQVTSTRWFEHITGLALRIWYEDLFERVLQTRKGECHMSECNTSERYRLFSNHFEPLGARGTGAPEGMLVSTRLIDDAPVESRYGMAPPDDGRYLQPSRVLLQCGGCRRVHVADTLPRVWEFVPEYLSKPRPDTAHGLCEMCREVYHGIRVRPAQVSRAAGDTHAREGG